MKCRECYALSCPFGTEHSKSGLCHLSPMTMASEIRSRLAALGTEVSRINGLLVRFERRCQEVQADE